MNLIRFLKNRIVELKLIVTRYNITDKKGENLVVADFSGAVEHGGLADRLKKMVALYAYCKHHNFSFVINHTHPFELRAYLDPKYDWVAKKNGISKNVLYAKPISCFKESIKNVEKRLTLKDKQLHVYNLSLWNYWVKKYGYSWAGLFFELFEPNEDIRIVIDRYKREYGEWYGLVFRFQNLLGDFEERHNYKNKNLTDNEKTTLIDCCYRYLADLDDLGVKILVCSDSTVFLSRVSDLEHVFTIPGKVVHMDSTLTSDYNIHLKSFLDFFMIAHSTRIFAVGSDFMYPTNFPLVASLLYKVPFERVRIDVPV